MSSRSETRTGGGGFFADVLQKQKGESGKNKMEKGQQYEHVPKMAVVVPRPRRLWNSHGLKVKRGEWWEEGYTWENNGVQSTVGKRVNRKQCIMKMPQ